MRKALVMSILIGIFWIPLAAARKSTVSAGIPLVRKRFAIFCIIYVLTILYIVPRLGGG
jgi:hypothetical protein